jgi:hypothetical protein
MGTTCVQLHLIAGRLCSTTFDASIAKPRHKLISIRRRTCVQRPLIAIAARLSCTIFSVRSCNT